MVIASSFFSNLIFLSILMFSICSFLDDMIILFYLEFDLNYILFFCCFFKLNFLVFRYGSGGGKWACRSSCWNFCGSEKATLQSLEVLINCVFFIAFKFFFPIIFCLSNLTLSQVRSNSERYITTSSSSQV